MIHQTHLVIKTECSSSTFHLWKSAISSPGRTPSHHLEQCLSSWVIPKANTACFPIPRIHKCLCYNQQEQCNPVKWMTDEMIKHLISAPIIFTHKTQNFQYYNFKWHLKVWLGKMILKIIKWKLYWWTKWAYSHSITFNFTRKISTF